MIGTYELSEILQIEHRLFVRLIKKYKLHFKELGQCKKTVCSKQMGCPVKNYFLNKFQLFFLISCLPNSVNFLNLKKLSIIFFNKNENEILNYLRNYKKIIKTGYVYLLEDHQGYVKIGRSVNPKHRIETLVTGGNLQLKNIFISPQTIQYGHIETTLHKKYENKLIKGEWFQINFEDAKTELKAKIAAM